MCGIVGYIGKKEAASILIEGLKKLEYRGYDSAGIAVINGQGFNARHSVGNLSKLSGKLEKDQLRGKIGLGHTRWATHGRPTQENAHPHFDCSGEFALVHNGIIENFQDLKDMLIKEGHSFASETDSEVIVHLIEKNYRGDLLQAVQTTMEELEGSYAFAVTTIDEPERIVAVRQDSPLILGLDGDGRYLASDIPALLPYTRQMIIMEDGEIADISSNGVKFYNVRGEYIEKEVKEIDWDVEMVEKDGYPHFMLKEINEEPGALRRIMGDYLKGGQVTGAAIDSLKDQIENIHRVYIVACGTAYHSGLVGKPLLEKATAIPVEVEVASEFRYRTPLLDEKTLVIVVSQSGETADTLAALRHAREKGAKTLALVNVQGSSIAREADEIMLLKGGPEIAVASTKAYLNMLAAFFLLFIGLGEKRKPGLNWEKFKGELREIPLLAEKVIKEVEQPSKKAAEYVEKWESSFFIGRGLDYSLVLEGALKLKEISYIHAQAYAAGELKHGTLALIEEGLPVVALLTQEDLLEKMISNIQEVKARGGYVIGITRENFKNRVEKEVDLVISIPPTEDFFTPLLSILPLQLFSYYTADMRGCPIDQPRNLAKSVTVE